MGEELRNRVAAVPYAPEEVVGKEVHFAEDARGLPALEEGHDTAELVLLQHQAVLHLLQGAFLQPLCHLGVRRGRTARAALAQSDKQIAIEHLTCCLHEETILPRRIDPAGKQDGDHLVQLILLRVWRRPGLLEDVPPEGVLAAVKREDLIARPAVGNVIPLHIQHEEAGVRVNIPAAGQQLADDRGLAGAGAAGDEDVALPYLIPEAQPEWTAPGIAAEQGELGAGRRDGLHLGLGHLEQHLSLPFQRICSSLWSCP